MTDSKIIDYQSKMQQQYRHQATKGSPAYQSKRSLLKQRKSLWELGCLGTTAAIALVLSNQEYAEPIGIRSAWEEAKGIVKLPIAQRFDLLLETRDAELSNQEVRWYLQDCVNELRKQLVPTRRK